MTTFLSNAAGLQLLCCSVVTDEGSPGIASSLNRQPIVAFRVEDDQSLTPVVMSGPVDRWREPRCSGQRGTVWAVLDTVSGICLGARQFPSETAFQTWAEDFVATNVAGRHEDANPHETLGTTIHGASVTRVAQVQSANSDDSPGLNLRVVRQRAETEAIREALALSGNNISRTAEILGVTRPTLYDLMQKNDIVVPDRTLEQ